MSVLYMMPMFMQKIRVSFIYIDSGNWMVSVGSDNALLPEPSWLPLVIICVVVCVCVIREMTVLLLLQYEGDISSYCVILKSFSFFILTQFQDKRILSYSRGTCRGRSEVSKCQSSSWSQLYIPSLFRSRKRIWLAVRCRWRHIHSYGKLASFPQRQGS